MRTLLIFLFCLVLLPAAEAPQGKVVTVIDGDSLLVTLEGQRAEIRLYGVDAPQLDQPFGSQSRQFVAGLTLGKRVEILIRDRDRFNRIVADVRLPNGDLLSHRLVSAGMAWWYKQFAPADGKLAKLEIEAKSARRGLWHGVKAVPPWTWPRRPQH